MDVRVIKPDDKLLITFPAYDEVPLHIMEMARKAVQKFNDDGNILILNGCEVYIIKDGVQILLKDELEKVCNEPKPKKSWWKRFYNFYFHE